MVNNAMSECMGCPLIYDYGCTSCDLKFEFDLFELVHPTSISEEDINWALQSIKEENVHMS